MFIDLFMELIRYERKEVVEQAVWGIGNLAGDRV